MTTGLKLHSFILLDFSPPDHAMYSKKSKLPWKIVQCFESSFTWPPGPTGLLPALTAASQPRTARPTGGGRERSRIPVRAATVERQPGAAAHSPARNAKLETTLKSAKTSLCASCTSLQLRLLTAEPQSSQSLANLKKSIQFLSNSRLRPFVLRVLCASAVRSVAARL